MKQQRLRFKLLALILFGLFALLAFYGLYSINAYGGRWFAYNRNPRIREQKQNVLAGSIYDRSGVLLAATNEDGTRLYHEDESVRRAMVHVLGDPQGHVANGVETFQTGYLYGFHTTLPELLNFRFTGKPRIGDNVTLTVDSALSAAITRYFSENGKTSGKYGAAIVMNYKTGEVLAMVSLPSFDPMAARASAAGSTYYWNRVTQSLYPPGSTFKIITTAAALESIPGAAEMSFDCLGGLDMNGQVIHDFGRTSHGKLTLRSAFVKSCNITYAKLALTMKDASLRKTAESFGFNDNFLFRDIVVENSQYPGGARSDFEVAMSGFGQSSIVASPLHMCLVAAGIANDGVIMEPTLLRGVTSSLTGADRDEFTPRVYRRAVSAETAATLQEYMRAVVTGGTGSRASVSGMTICGKTGSAETSSKGRDVTHGWFVGYAADESLPFALAVIVEDIAEGEGGGSTAAPIAGEIFKYLRDHAEQFQ
ncbi:MAG: penicillin-binding protein 2 [Clostridia bacterium]|nr:penicillin-binding protein 2 [Clostridia bacterium]